MVFRSSRHIYAQLIDDMSGKTLVPVNTLNMKGAGVGGNCKGAELAGQKIAETAVSKSIKKVVFDRNGFIYHGRIQVLAESARKFGLVF